MAKYRCDECECECRLETKVPGWEPDKCVNGFEAQGCEWVEAIIVKSPEGSELKKMGEE